MIPDIFFKNFELLADAPNGIQKLRELVLQLAVMGKLVPQDPEDEPASMLVERIKTEKKSIDKKGKNNGSKQLHPVTEDDIQFEVPNNWEIVRLGQVYDIEYGKSLSEKNRNNEGEFPVYGSNGIVGFHTEYLVDKPSLIIGRKGSAGAVNLSNKPFWPIDTTYFVTPKEGLDLFFSYYLFKTLDLGKFNKATAIPGLNRQDAYELIIKIPPLAEQKRIVSKVDELMAFFDKLEARRLKKQEIQSKLNSAVLDRMLSADSQEEFEQYWQHICENFDLLYDNPENVEKLKQVILQLAVQGKLVPQNPKDEPASILIEQIATDKGRKQNRLSSSKVTDTLDLEFKLPKNWELSKIEEFSLLVTDGEHKTPTRIDRPEVPLVTAKNVRDGYLDLRNTDFVSNETAEKCWKRCNPSHNDILMVCVGATTGRLCLIKKPIKFVLVRSVSLIRVDEKYIYPEYVALAMKSPLLQSQIWGNVKQSAQPCLYLNKIQNLFVPLPPLAEQKRIVEKIEQLMGLCDELEAKLRQKRENSEKIMETVVSGVLEGTVA